MTLVNNKSQFTNHFNFSTVVIVTISIAFAWMISSGLYGYGNDYYSSYYKPNLNWGGLFDRLGWILSTLTINGVHLGIQIVTFLLALSVGFLLREHIKFKQSYSLIFFLLLYVIAIHTWPIIMSTTNAMRQGLSMSFIFIAFVAGSRKSFYWMLLYTIFAIFTHKSGLILSAVVVFAYIMNNFLLSFAYSSKIVLNFLIGIILLILSYFFIQFSGLEDGGKPSKIIGGDFRAAFIFIGFIYVSLSFFYKKILDNSFNLSLYYFSFVAPALLMNGLNWEYERLGMMMLIPYILSFGNLLNRYSYQIYLLLIFLLLLLLTVITGMYASFK